MIKLFPDVSPSNGKLVSQNQNQENKIVKKNSSSLRWGKSFFSLGLLILLAASQGCKDPDEIGLNILPETDQLGNRYTDTATIVTSTLKEDSIVTSQLSSQLLGSTYDPTFGVTTANVYAQAVISGGTPTFGTAPVADSVVLSLVYNGSYGDTNQTQTLTISRLTEELSIDSSYYSFRTFTTESTPLATYSFLPRPNTRVAVDSDTLAAQLWITLDKTLADSIIALNGSTTLQSNTNWLSYFKGLAITATPMSTPSTGAISSFNFFNSSLIVYYHDGTSSKKYAFALANARVNNFVHDFTGTEAEQVINAGTADTISFVQGACGLKTRISFPYLKHFLDSGSILVNRAELTITAKDPSNPFFSVPNKLLLISKNEAGANIFPIDYYESSGYYGGDYNSSTKEYKFNIARQIQGYLDGRYTSPDYYIVVSGAGVTPNQLAVGSSTNANYRLKLSLYYTKLN